MMADGLLDEVKGLMNMGLTLDNTSMLGIGYKEVIEYLEGKYDLERMLEVLKQNSRKYAKRQMTWFKRYEEVQWFDVTQYETYERALEVLIEKIEKQI